MKYRITLRNPGGELDHRDANTSTDAARQAIEMIKATGYLYSGDQITVERGDDQDDDE